MNGGEGGGRAIDQGCRTLGPLCPLEPQEGYPGRARPDGRHSAGDSGVMCVVGGWGGGASLSWDGAGVLFRMG